MKLASPVVLGAVVSGSLVLPACQAAPTAAPAAHTPATQPTLPLKLNLDQTDTPYAPQTGYGFDGPHEAGKNFRLAINVPYGNYDVTLILGDTKTPSATTVKAESRRLMLENIRTGAGETLSRTFTVNVRDGQLNLEFLGENPSLRSLEIKRNETAPTVYLAGDSTVTDQQKEPWAAWGQMLPRFFKSGVAIANHAESGRALKSFIWEKRLDAILNTIKPGDYLFIQFTHNDQKEGAAHVEPFTTFKEQLQIYIDAARKHGATPVLVTSMHRRFFNPDGSVQNTLGDYPEAMRQKAAEEKVALIDLNAMSKTLYEAWGPNDSKKAFVFYPAGTYPGQDKELKDNTHFNAYGAYELARCMVEGIKKLDLPLKNFLTDDLPGFDPAHPDSVENFDVPASSGSSITKPEGS